MSHDTKDRQRDTPRCFECTYMSVRVCYVPICLFCLYDLCMCTCICIRLDRWMDEIFESVHMRGGQREIRPYAYILVYTYIRNDLFDMRTHTRLYTGDTARFDWCARRRQCERLGRCSGPACSGAGHWSTTFQCHVRHDTQKVPWSHARLFSVRELKLV